MEIEDIIKNRNKIKKVEDYSGVYFLIKNSKIIYIGTALFCEDRVKAHKKNKRMNFDSYYVMKIKDKSERNNIERSYIQKIKPLFNFDWNPDYNDGKKDMLYLFLKKFDSAKEVSLLCDVKDKDVLDFVFKRREVNEETKESIVNVLLSRKQFCKRTL